MMFEITGFDYLELDEMETPLIIRGASITSNSRYSQSLSFQTPESIVDFLDQFSRIIDLHGLLLTHSCCPHGEIPKF